MRQKYRRRLWYSLPPPALFSVKNFDSNNFVEHRRVPLQRLSVLWDNKFSINKRDIHLLGTKTFDIRNFLKDRRILLPNNSALWDKKSLQKIVILLPYSSPLFLILEMLWDAEGFPYEVFRYCETKNIPTKVWYSPPNHKKFRYLSFSEKQKGSCKVNFVTVTQKKLQKIVTLSPSSSPFIHKTFRLQKFCETQKSFPTVIFGTVRQNIFDGKTSHTPVKQKKFFHTRN